MQSLRNLQHGVMDALLGRCPPVAGLLEHDSTTRRALPTPLATQPVDTALPRSARLGALRLTVHQNNVVGNFLDALRSSFPVICRLVGEDYFRRIAREFQRRYPSRSGNLLPAGAPFPEYLREIHGTDEFAYLTDVAQLEWLCQESLLAARHPPLDLTKLREIAPAAYDSLRFKLHPALRLFESRFPAQRVWQANVDSEVEPERIDLASGADCLAIHHHEYSLIFLPTAPAEHIFLSAVGRGETFASAIDASTQVDDRFDAGAALQRWVAAHAIVDFE